MGIRSKKSKIWSFDNIFGKQKPVVPSNTTRYYGRSIMDDIADEEKEEEQIISGRKQLWVDSYPSRKAEKKHANGRNHVGVIYPLSGRVNHQSQWGHQVYPKTKAYVYQASEWSNYNTYYTSYLVSDDDDNLIVKSPESYLTPTVDQIQAKLSVYGQSKINRIKEMARVCYFKMIDDKDYLIEAYEKDTVNLPIDHSEYGKRIAIFKNIFETFVPGYTPLEQAIHIHYKLEDADAISRGGKDRGTSNVDFTFKRDDYADPAINTQLTMNPLSENNSMEILNKISIVGKFGSQFSVAKEIGEKFTNNSDVFKKTTMRDYGQFQQIELYQRMFPNFRTKFLTKDLIVNAPVLISEKKQVLIVLLDYSGSMNEETKQIWVNAFLIDRFRYVIKGEAEIFFSYFVSSIHELKFQHIKNKKDVERFWCTFSNRPSGGATDIGRIVEYVADEVKKGKLHNLNVDLRTQKPEILIINDGRFGLDV